MKKFLTQLSKGVLSKDVLKSEKELVEYLLKQKILKGKKELKLKVDYLFGTIDINSKGIGFLSPLVGDKKDFLIEKSDLNGATKGDLVLAMRLRKRNGRPKAKVLMLIQKASETIVAYLCFTPEPVVKNIKNDTIIDTKIKPKQLKKLPEYSVFKLDSYTYEIIEILGNLKNPLVDEKISLALYNKKEEFSKQAINESKSFGDFVDKSLYDRDDLTDLDFCTIDPSDAKDHDDAIYYDKTNNVLYVAIADVSEYVYMNSAIDKEAENRGFSIYFPHKSIPMLPRELSENICSLKEKEDRLAFVVKIYFDDEFNVTKEEFVEAIICSKKKYSYNYVDLMLFDKIESKDYVDVKILSWLKPLFEITKILKDKRLQSGLDFASDEIRMVLDDEGKLKKVNVQKNTPSHSLIEDCMLLANKASAKMIDFGIFRTHSKPKRKDINELLNELLSFGIDIDQKQDYLTMLKEIQKQAKELGISKDVDKMIIRTQQQAKYESFSNQHFALGFEKYTHFTSPIRRYSDLILHRLLKAVIRKDKKLQNFILRNIESLVVKISSLEREAMKIEWDFYDRKFARWAYENIGKTFKAKIVDTKMPPIAKIEDEIVGARVFLDKQKVELFSKINVVIVDVNLATTKIKGRIVEEC